MKRLKSPKMDAAVANYLGSLPDRRRGDAETLISIMGRVTGEEPFMWGSIVGFGNYHYHYASGREGDAPAAGFAARKSAMTIYLGDGVSAYPDLLEALGPHTTGVGCLYVKDLSKVDLETLETIIGQSYATLTEGVYANRARDGGSAGA